ncbi:hypothetical protein [Maribellus mangrovi]|uniref:hypothetical protein n=1 Tax=Maribellus mangrovi TaxID=3133146 RepID=UPI0030EC1567
MQQGACTLQTRIKSKAINDLEALLAVINNDLEGNGIIPLKRMSDTHFARFVILKELSEENGQDMRFSLVFSSNFDGSIENHLRQIVELAGEGLDKVYQFCEDYPDKPTPDSRLNYLRSHQIKSQAFYVNTVGRTLHQVKQDIQLREQIEQFLDQRDWSDYDVENLRSAIQNFVTKTPSLKWATPSDTKRKSFWSAGEMFKFAVIVVVGIVLLPIIIPLSLIGIVALRIKEKQDNRASDPVVKNLKRHPELVIREDFAVQNQFSAIGFVKPGWVRNLTIKIVLWGINLGAHFLYNKGKLTGVDTIHFARWIMLDQNRRVLFFSNYDGSLESYMDDFINKVAWGLNAAFSNGIGYPKTNWLVKDGAKDEHAFKAFINKHQIVTQVWDTAYPGLSAVNLANNAKIREGLWSTMGITEIEEWLQRF